MKIIEMQHRTPQQIAQLVEVWESSVRATHHFLSDAEVEQIKQYVPQALTEVAHLFVAQQGEQPVGFMGIEKDSLEMLFLAPQARGKGLGKQLLQEGIARGVRRLTRRRVSFMSTWAFGFTKGQIATSRAIPTRCSIWNWRRTRNDEENILWLGNSLAGDHLFGHVHRDGDNQQGI